NPDTPLHPWIQRCGNCRFAWHIARHDRRQSFPFSGATQETRQVGAWRKSMRHAARNSKDIVHRFLQQLGDPEPNVDQTEPVAARVLERLRPHATGVAPSPMPMRSPRLWRKSFRRMTLAGATFAFAAVSVFVYMRT